VAAAREQAEERRLEGLGFQVQRCHVPVQVVDGREREPSPERDSLRRSDADEERPDQAGPACDADEIDVVERCAALVERVADDVRDELEVPPRRHLRHDAAEARVQLGLRRDDVRPHAPVLDDRRGGLVARRLDPEDHPRAGSRTGSFHMISASSRLSV
jgi:hypothetical protein